MWHIYIYISKKKCKTPIQLLFGSKGVRKFKRDPHVFLKRLLGGTLEVIRGEREEDKKGKCLFTFNFVVHKRMKLAKTNKKINKINK